MVRARGRGAAQPARLRRARGGMRGRARNRRPHRRAHASGVRGQPDGRGRDALRGRVIRSGGEGGRRHRGHRQRHAGRDYCSARAVDRGQAASMARGRRHHRRGEDGLSPRARGRARGYAHPQAPRRSQRPAADRGHLPGRPRQAPDLGARLGSYTKQVASWCADAHVAGARFCDVFCDRGYFSVSQPRRILKAALEAQLIPRIHADELARTGGARLAAALHAASADHLLCANRGDAVALARAGVVATLAPGTALSIGKLPPVKELNDAGAVIALGTDHNPGTSGLTSMSAVVALAVAVFKMSVERALVAATLGGAYSLSRSDRGVVAPHKVADLVLWDAEHEGAFAWAYGLKPRVVWLRGTQVFA